MLTDTPLSVADVLERAADKLEAPGAWTQGELARTATGAVVPSSNPTATCWCAEGAIVSECRAANVAATPVMDAMRAVIIQPAIHVWNDSDGRNQSEVVAKIREAAWLARAGDA